MTDYRDLVRSICQQPFDGGRVWRAHGIGMLRTYLDAEQLFRLNLWHHSLLTPNISTMHTHTWSLHSEVVTGRLTNTRWERTSKGRPEAQPFIEDRIPCGAAQDAASGPPVLQGEAKTVWLFPCAPEVILPGHTYGQQPDEIHTTEFIDGTATVMKRDMTEGLTEASVFWPLGSQWGDASRNVNADEIVRVCHATLALIDL